MGLVERKVVRYGDVMDLGRKMGEGNIEKEMVDWDRLEVGGNGRKESFRNQKEQNLR
jgi:hypothetical protein